VLVLLFVASRPSYENRHLVIAGFTLWSWGLLTSSVTRFHVVFSIDFTTVGVVSFGCARYCTCYV
jgi:hypothetical protein